jgi:uncharacterized protein YjbJ (UPF0337 family)
LVVEREIFAACNLGRVAKSKGVYPALQYSNLSKRDNKMKPSTKDEVAGKVHEVKGKIKERAGQLTSNPDLESECHDEKVGGKVQKKIGPVENAVEK